MIEPTVLPLRGYTGTMPKYVKSLRDRIIEREDADEAAAPLGADLNAPTGIADASPDLKRDLAVIYEQTVGSGSQSPPRSAPPAEAPVDPRTISKLPADHILRAVEYPSNPPADIPRPDSVSGYCGHRPGAFTVVGMSTTAAFLPTSPHNPSTVRLERSGSPAATKGGAAATP